MPQEPASGKPNVSEKTYDVVVIGAGFAGLSAALAARETGAEVAVLEKTRAPGGNSIISDGGIAAPGTALQEKAGIHDSSQLMAEDMIRAGLGLNHPELVQRVADGAEEAFRWTRDTLRVPYLDRVDRFGGHTVPRCYTPEGLSGGPLIKALVRRAEAEGIPLLTGTQAARFLTETDPQTGGLRITGAAARPFQPKKPKPEETASGETSDPSGPREETLYRARRGVIIAAGGYGADAPFRSAQDPRLTPAVDTTNKPFATAEILRQALRLGAAPVQLSHIQLGAWASPEEKGFGDGPLFADYIGFLYGLIVHPDTARRYVNEQADRKQVADAVLAVGKPSVCLSDAAAVNRSGWDLSRALGKGVLQTFPSLSALARHYQLPADALADTVSRFSQAVSRGHDPDFGRPIPNEAAPLTQPPYYAMRIWPKVHYTMGGLRISPRAQVLDLEGAPIPGLYAAGEVTGGIHGASRLGSCAITDCLVFGRTAGRTAAG